MKQQLVAQFLTESFLFFFISTVVALLIAAICWPAFSARVTAYQFILPLFDVKNMAIVFLIFGAGGLLAGAYPAFFLSSIQPARILRGLSKFGINLTIRKALVILQFSISGVLIISTIVIHQQLDFVNNARLGFNKAHLIDLPFYIHNSHQTTFKNELSRNSAIQSVTVATWEIGKQYGGWSSMNDLKDTTKQVTYQFIDADISFIKTMGVNLVAGRDFSNEHSNDTLSLDNLFRKNLPYNQFKIIVAAKSIILNQEAVKSLELKNPVGTILNTGAVQGTVIGVVQDFNGLSLHQKISPIVIRCDAEGVFGHLFIRISPYNTQKTIDYIQDEWISPSWTTKFKLYIRQISA
jgi:putative ABC transport system permease protein